MWFNLKYRGRKPQIKQQMKEAIQDDGIELKRMMWENALMVWKRDKNSNKPMKEIII